MRKLKSRTRPNPARGGGRLAALLALCFALTLFGGCRGTTGGSVRSASYHLPGVTEAMYKPSYWTGKLKNPQETLLSASQITQVNAQFAANAELDVADLVSFPSALSSAQLLRNINAFTLPTANVYDGEGAQLAEAFFDDLVASVNAAGVAESNKVSYAIALRNANLRRFPTVTAAYADKESREADVFQQGLLPVGEPVLVLHTSLEQNWFFIQTRSQRGWVRAEDLIFMEKGSWASYIHTEDFLIVTAPSIVLETNPYSPELSGLTLYMGTKLPLYTDTTASEEVYHRTTAGCYVVKYPTVDRFGYLEYQPLLIPISDSVHIGYLPYTQENIVTQALRLVGGRYSERRMYGGRDNAAFVADLYSCFGLYLPAETALQEKAAAQDTDMSDMTTAERLKHLRSLPAGTLLFNAKQAFVYLGTEGQTAFVVHPLREYYTGDKRYTANATVLSGLDIVEADGTAFLDTLRLSKRMAVVKTGN